MDGNKKRKCKNCGRLFTPPREDEPFCSQLCRTTALFVGGGGDQTKPLAEGMSKKAKEAIKGMAKDIPPKPSRRGSDEKFPRVKGLFELPQEKRWGFARTFSPDEMAYARRLAHRMLNEDKLIDELCSWEMNQEGETEPDEGSLGESDDGSV